MADGNSIPEGWVLGTMNKRDGTQVKCYLCPATGHRFFTYEALMRYVDYAEAAKLSMYLPAFEVRRKAKKKGQSLNSLADDQDFFLMVQYVESMKRSIYAPNLGEQSCVTTETESSSASSSSEVEQF